ncbi:3-mercaptopyruvate sulfurtransferase [Microbaculum sp. FT89]|uniref:3-mercaptopyruvate sulfurtransferase n=1 Tax=Microbaculum sp. FT89 TaxID=3447298 RepID=UPI003F535CC4
MAGERAQFLASTDWLAEHLSAPDLVVVDGSWYLPHMERDPKAEYLENHIPGAVHFDIDDIADTTTDLPHMLPRPEKFSSRMRKLGIGDGQRIVVYDGAGLYSAARVWWMFRIMGVADVAVLDGGLPKWLAENRPVESGPVTRQERHFTARLDHGAVRDAEDVLRSLGNGYETVLDARSPGRFAGIEPEPREGVRGGHMPGSVNLPWDSLVAPEGVLKSDDELKATFDAVGVNRRTPVITSCGSGVTAAILVLALQVIGHRQTAVYDGSWCEWGGRADLPVATGME